jgi:hypothetical protein
MAARGRPRKSAPLRHAQIDGIDPDGTIHLRLRGSAPLQEFLRDLTSEGARAHAVATDLLSHRSARENPIDQKILEMADDGKSDQAIAQLIKKKHGVTLDRTTIRRRRRALQGVRITT